MSKPDFDRQAFRSWLQEVFGARAEQAEAVVDGFFKARKRVRREITCFKCGAKSRHDIDVTDQRFQLDGLKWLSEATFGRPATDQGNGGAQEFTFVNRIITGCPDCDCESCRADQVNEARSSSLDGWKVETLVKDREESEDGG